MRRRGLADLVSAEAVDRMLADADAAGVSAEGLLGQLTRTVLERALGAELDDHLGYVKGDPAGNGSGNSRNGSCRAVRQRPSSQSAGNRARDLEDNRSSRDCRAGMVVGSSARWQMRKDASPHRRPGPQRWWLAGHTATVTCREAGCGRPCLARSTAWSPTPR